MRISETRVAQFIESDPPRMVLVDEFHGAEIALTKVEVEIVPGVASSHRPTVGMTGGCSSRSRTSTRHSTASHGLTGGSR